MIQNLFRCLKVYTSMVLLVIAICISEAATIEVVKDKIHYSLDLETNEAEVYNCSWSSITNLIIPDFIEYNNTQIPIISIHKSTFYQNKSLKGSQVIVNQYLSNRRIDSMEKMNEKLKSWCSE